MRENWASIGDDSFQLSQLGVHVDNLFRHPGIYMLGRNPRKEVVAFYPLNDATCHIHLCFSSDVEEKLDITRSAVKWMFDNANYTSMIALAPANRRDVCLFAAACGMYRAGIIKRGFRKGGEVCDQIIYQYADSDYKEMRKWLQQ